MNNVGKSTVCEAIELVLGPDRPSRTPPVEEFDFLNPHYLEQDGGTPIEFDVTLTELSEEVANKVRAAHPSLALGRKTSTWDRVRLLSSTIEPPANV